MTDKQEILAKYILDHSCVITDAERIAELAEGMSAQDMVEALEDAFKRFDKLKSSGLGRELA